MARLRERVMNRLRWTTTSSRVLGALAVAAMWLSLARPATAQSVTSADIQRLQDQLYDANNEVSRVHGSQDTAGELQNQLDDLRDEVVYLKVKLRKEGSVSRSEYTDLQKRILDVRTRAHAELSNSSGGNNGGWRTNNDPYGSGSNNGVSGGVSAGTADDRARTGQTGRGHSRNQCDPGGSGDRLQPRDRVVVGDRAGRTAFPGDDGRQSLYGQPGADPGGIDASRRGQLGHQGDAD